MRNLGSVIIEIAVFAMVISFFGLAFSEKGDGSNNNSDSNKGY